MTDMRIPATDDIPEWFAYMVGGTINDHWWNGSDEELGMDFDPEECGPCSSLREMPFDLLEAGARKYIEIGGNATWWDKRKDSFRDGVDFSAPGDIDALCAAEEAEDDA